MKESSVTAFYIVDVIRQRKELHKNMREIFRKLATNSYIEDFDYSTRFRFQTVHHQSAYSYCYCWFGFENEFVGYIADDGTINEDIFEEIVQSIIEGKCPHITSNVPKDWILETCVTAAHVAIASGTWLEKDEDLRRVYMSHLGSSGILI